jgi:hypothetical protein
VPNRQERPVGISADGETIVYMAGKPCLDDRLFVGRRQGDSFASVDITDDPELAGLSIIEGCCSFGADGQSLVVLAGNQAGFLFARLSGSDVLAPDEDPFLELNRSVPAGSKLRNPVLAPDGRTLYYQQLTADGESEIEESSRADIHAPFSAGAKVPGAVQRYDYVTGISADGLALFATALDETHVLVRASRDDAFIGGANDPTAATIRILGSFAIPIGGDPSRLITVLHAGGGCHNEELVYLDAVPP